MSTKYKRSEEFVYNEIDGELVMMNAESGKYLSLNTTGKDIWDLLEEPKTVTGIIEGLLNMYNVSPKECEEEVNSFVNKMLEQGLLATE